MDAGEALTRIQQEEALILSVFSEYCETHDIPWFLCGGTALGAARHDGFIPWDDDIDVGMLREDFERFAELSKSDFPDEYEIHLPGERDDYAPMFAKICKRGTKFYTDETCDAGYDQGIFIDVFPFDCLSDNFEQRQKQINNAVLWQRVSYIYHSRHINVPDGGVKRCVELLGCALLNLVFRAALNPSLIYKRYMRSVIWLDGRGDPMRDNASRERIALPSALMGSVREDVIVPTAPLSFEGGRYPAPGKIDEYLSITYGNWRQVPPPEQRHTHLPKFIQFSDGSTWESK